MTTNQFDVPITMGLVVKSNTKDLQELLDFISERPSIFLVYKKTSGGKLRLVEE